MTNSPTDVQKFFKLLDVDINKREKFYAAFKKLTPRDWPGFVALGQAEGYTFSVDELKGILGEEFYTGRRAAWKDAGPVEPIPDPGPEREIEGRDDVVREGGPGSIGDDYGRPEQPEMAVTGAEVLEQFLLHLSDGLANEEGRHEMMASARQFPPLSKAFMEVVLHGDRQVDDLAFYVKASEKHKFVRPAGADSAEWDGLMTFIENWRDDNSVLGKAVDAILLPINLTSEGVAISWLVYDVSGPHKLSAVETGLDKLGLASENVHNYVKEIVSQLENDHGFTVEVGLTVDMSDFPESRIIINDIHNVTELSRVLDTLGWSEGTTNLAEVLNFMPETAKYSLLFDLKRGLGRGEFGLKVTLGDDEKGWGQVFDSLKGLGVCSEGHRTMIMDEWYGSVEADTVSHPALPGIEHWHGSQIRQLKRGIDHIRIGIGGNKILGGGGYLFFEYL